VKKIYLLATFVAIMTGIAVYAFASGLEADNTPVVVQYEMVSVVAAATDIPVNTILTKEMLVLVEIPKQSTSEGMVSDIESLVGKTTKYPMSKGEHFFINKAVEIGERGNNRLSDRIRAGYRAYTIYTDEVGGIAGYLRVGDKIDIMVTIEVTTEETTEETTDGTTDGGSETKKVTEPVTYYFMQNISVIAVGSASQYTGGVKELNSYSNMTLEIPVEDCTMLSYYVSKGFVRIVLRGFGDDAEIGVSAFRMEKAGIWIS
jgi:pilus assembly protein CpaB